MDSSKIYIIGIGDDGLEGLTRQALEKILNAEVIVGTQPHLDKVPNFQGQKIAIGGSMEPLVQAVQENHDKRIVLFTSGDPLFYGVARYLCTRLGKERFEVIPHVSSMQLAFARVKESWDEAYLTNLASQSLDRAVEKIRSAEKVGIFTSENYSPPHIAGYLLQRGLDYFTAYVCENLGSPDERVTRGTLAEIAKLSFSQLNVMVLIRTPGVPDRAIGLEGRRLFGNPDELFLQSKPKRGLLTSSEVRVIAIAEMQLSQDSLVWDVGAGSGSVAIEAAQIASNGMVYGIEMDAEDYNLLVENAKRFNVSNLVPVLGQAPQAWQALPDPDAIFVGGTGRAVCDLVRDAWHRLRPNGSLVASISSLEHVAAVQTMLQDELQAEPEVRMIQISRSYYRLGRSPLESSNPTFLVKAIKIQNKSS